MVLYAFVWEKGKTMDFSETIVVYDLKLATDDRSDKKFLLTSILCPLGALCPLPRGYIHVLNHGTRKSITYNYMLYKGVVVSKINNHYSIVYLGLTN